MDGMYQPINSQQKQRKEKREVLWFREGKEMSLGLVSFPVSLWILVWFGSAMAGSGNEGKEVEIEWGFLMGQLLGGLSLFLYGMKLMCDSLKASTGDQMKEILRSLSSSKVIGLFTGIFVTGVLQSSAVVSVMVVGFVSSGLMTFRQTLGILLGAGIGTTLTSQMVAFDVTRYSLWLVTIGFAMRTFSSKQMMEYYGIGTLGLGLVFYGIDVMSNSMVPLRTFQPFLHVLVKMSNPVLGIIFSAIFTALIQSSTATVGIVMALSSQKLITLKAGVSLILGANIGTGITAILAGLSSTREAKRVALANIIFKMAGVICVLPFLSQFMGFLQSTSDEMPRQLANAHTFWNVGVALVFLPLSDRIAELVIWLLPDHPVEHVTGNEIQKTATMDPMPNRSKDA